MASPKIPLNKDHLRQALYLQTVNDPDLAPDKKALSLSLLKDNANVLAEVLEKNKISADDLITCARIAALLESTAALEVLFKKGNINPNVRLDEKDTTFLHYAVRNNLCQTLKTLLQLGGDPSARAKAQEESLTPAELAQKMGLTEAEKILADFKMEQQALAMAQTNRNLSLLAPCPRRR